MPRLAAASSSSRMAAMARPSRIPSSRWQSQQAMASSARVNST